MVASENNRCCVADEYGNWCDAIDTILQHDNKSYCIFHAPSDCSDKSMKWNNKLVFDYIENASDNKICSLAGAFFPEDIDFSSAFANKTVPDITFMESVFSGKAVFDDVTFYDWAQFTGAHFKEEASFACVVFNDFSAFQNVKFDKVVSFVRAKFSHCANFNGTIFLDGAEFGGALFLNTAMFGLYGDQPCVFNKVNFGGTTFEKCAYFYNTVFNDGDFIACTVNTTLEFDRVDLRKLPILGAPVEKFRFISCKWPETNGRKTIYDARMVGNKGYFKLTNLDHPPENEPEEIPPAGQLEDLFRRLKKVAKSENDETLASDWHYNEKEMLRLRLKEVSAFKGLRFNFGWFDSAFLFLMTTAYKWVSGYGEEPLRAFIVLSLLVIMPIPILSFSLGITSFFPGNPLSYIPFMRVEASAEGPLFHNLWMIFWQLLITAQAALFGFALRNKLRR